MSERDQKFERSTGGLRDALMSEMEDMRAGIASPDEAFAFAKLAEKVIDTLHAELDVRIYEDRKALEKEERARLALAPPHQQEETENV